ncbi:MAG: lysophospholipase [Acidimicrobiales bacterium]
MAAQAHLSLKPGTAVPCRSWELEGERACKLFARVWGPEAVLQSPAGGERTAAGENLADSDGTGGGRAAVTRAPSVIVVHGFGEHAGRYEELASALASAGWSTWAVDLRGHGLSEGHRADIEELGLVLGDLDRLTRQAARHCQGAPLVLLGHSMGGPIAATYASAHAELVSGLVLSAPALHLASAASATVFAVRVLARAWPRAGVTNVPPFALSRDTEEVARFVNDPLVWHGSVPARTAVEMHRAALAAMAAAPALHMPVLMLHGSEDRIVPVEASRRFFAQLGSTDKDLRVFHGSRHETLHELGKRAVVADLVAWLAQRWPGAAVPAGGPVRPVGEQPPPQA